MEKSPQRNNYRNLLAVVAGIICTFLTGLILYPIVSIIFDKYFHLFGYPEGNEQRDSLIILFTLIFWLFISSLSGGAICTLIAVTRKWRPIIFCMSITIFVLIILTRRDIFSNLLLESFLLILIIPLGFITGYWLGKKIKAKRAGNRNAKTIAQDNSSS